MVNNIILHNRYGIRSVIVDATKHQTQRNQVTIRDSWLGTTSGGIGCEDTDGRWLMPDTEITDNSTQTSSQKDHEGKTQANNTTNNHHTSNQNASMNYDDSADDVLRAGLITPYFVRFSRPIPGIHQYYGFDAHYGYTEIISRFCTLLSF